MFDTTTILIILVTAIVVAGLTVAAIKLLDHLRKVEANRETLQAQLADLPGVTSVAAATPVDEAHRFTVYAGSDVRDAVFGWAVKRGHVLVELSAERRDLEEVFRRLTRDSGETA